MVTNVLKTFRYYYYLKLSKNFVLPIPSYNLHSLMGVNNCSLTQAHRKYHVLYFL